MSRITAHVLAQHMTEHDSSPTFDLCIEQIKRLRGLATADRRKADSLRALAAAKRAEADQLDTDARNAEQLVKGWDDMADDKFAEGVFDEDAAWQSLTDGQRERGHCIVCDGEITDEAPGVRAGFLLEHPVFMHADGAVCKAVAK